MVTAFSSPSSSGANSGEIRYTSRCSFSSNKKASKCQSGCTRKNVWGSGRDRTGTVKVMVRVAIADAGSTVMRKRAGSKGSSSGFTTLPRNASARNGSAAWGSSGVCGCVCLLCISSSAIEGASLIVTQTGSFVLALHLSQPFERGFLDQDPFPDLRGLDPPGLNQSIDGRQTHAKREGRDLSRDEDTVRDDHV